MAAKKVDPKKKKLIQIIVLISVLAGFLLLMIFVTLPALGIELFGGKRSIAVKTTPKTPSTTSTQQVKTAPTSSDDSKVDEQYLKKVLEEISKNETHSHFDSEAFKPYFFNFENEDQVKEILINSTNITEFKEGLFLSYFLTESEEKTAWIKTQAEPNKVYELKINSTIPNVPYPLQVIEITPMGVLLYRYPDEKEQEQQNTPRLYRLLARPFIEITELKTEIH